MINLSNQERETLWFDILKQELTSLLNDPSPSGSGSESSKETINFYLHTINYNNKIGGRFINQCIISLNNLSNWS
jgi:hypothetical protein